MPQITEETADAAAPTAVKPCTPIYVATWRENDCVRELRLREEDLANLQADVRTALEGKTSEPLEDTVQRYAKAAGWLFDAEKLSFIASDPAGDVSESEKEHLHHNRCVYLRFVFHPANDEKLRRRHLRRRNPEWVESDRNRWLTGISTITLLLVVIQLGLLLQQNAQFDEALRKFESVVQAYLWQVNTPALGAEYLSDTSDIELTNYGLTPISVSQATLATDSRHYSPLLAYGKVLRLRGGEAQRISTLRPDVSGADIAKGVTIEIIYIYLGNPYKLTWPAEVRFKGETPRVEPKGEPTVPPIKR
jgi:hypothetical protein